jgi:hypothetical protein
MFEKFSVGLEAKNKKTLIWTQIQTGSVFRNSLDPDPYSEKCLGPDPDQNSVNPDPKHWFFCEQPYRRTALAIRAPPFKMAASLPMPRSKAEAAFPAQLFKMAAPSCCPAFRTDPTGTQGETICLFLIVLKILLIMFLLKLGNKLIAFLLYF